MQVKITRGLDLAPARQPGGEIDSDRPASVAALVGSDCPGLRPTFHVGVGDKVTIGQTLFVDRKRPQIAFSAPVSGRVSEIRLGHRRTLDIIAIARDDERNRDFQVPRLSDPEGVRRLLLKSGQWPAFRTRPFERIPDHDARPAAIFVTAIDTEPLCGDPGEILRQDTDAFRTGLLAIRNLTDGPVFVCQSRNESRDINTEQVRFVEFAGPHPAGLPGTHIHRLMPVSRTRHVWHIGYQDVIAIGRLFETGRIWSERIVRVDGPGIREPVRARTCLGADLTDLVADGNVADNISTLSGSLLSGRPARFLGRYHNQATVLIRDQAWTKRGLLGRLARLLDDGRAGAIIPIAAHDNVMAFDIPPVPLLRALSVGDAETAEQLGCLELAESDVALLTYVCPSKLDYAPLLRKALDEIETWI